MLYQGTARAWALNASTGSYEYLSNFSEDSPTLKPPSVRSVSTRSATVNMSWSSLGDETESVSEDGSNNPSGSLDAEREQDVSYTTACCIREQLGRGTLDAPRGRHAYPSDFSEDSPISQPSSVKSVSTLSPTVRISRSGLPDDAEPVPQDGPNSPCGSREAERELDVPMNSYQCTAEAAHGRGPITVPLPTPDDHEYEETQEAHGSNGDEAPQISPQRRRHDLATTANNLYLLGDEHHFQDQDGQALKAFNDALQLYRELDNRPRIARCLRMIGVCAMWHSTEERTAYLEASKVYRELGDRKDAAQCVHTVGQLLWEERKYSEAGTTYYELLGLYRELGDPLEVAKCLHMIREVERAQEQYEAGISAYTEAYKLFLELGDLLGVAKNLSMIGACKRSVSGLSNETLATYREASQYYQKLGHRTDEARCMQIVGECHREQGRYKDAQDAYRAASVIYEKLSYQLGVGHCLSMITECQRERDHLSV
ncbi:hypothetical protein FRB94_014639 [Tulasnella sp. JGI-2019a]|nr:hypothetical protein FRB94_014639 [Tulasnella sp. JGI-2019a]